MEPTDARYAEIGREMVASGDWLTPRLNGVTHLDKPPVAYWMAAGGMRLLGVNETGAHIGAALAAAFLFWAAACIARRAGLPPRESFLAPLVLASSALAFALSRLLATDIFLAAAVAGFYVAWLAPGGRGRLWMFVVLGTGFLIKGPVIFVHTLLPLTVAALWRRDRSLLAGLGKPLGWVMFALIAFPWYVIVAEKTPGLLTWLLHKEIWQRYTTTVHHRSGPPWYFLAILVAGALPWTAAALHGMFRAARANGGGPSSASAALVAWAIVPVIFFSASGSKLPAYVLPEVVAVTILAAGALVRSSGVARWGTALLFAGLAVMIETMGPRALAGLVGAQHAPTLPLPSLAHFATAAFAVGAIAAAARMPAAAALTALVAWYGLLGAARTIEGPLGSPVAVARAMERIRQPGEPVIELGAFSAGLPFYAGATIPMVDVPRTEAFESPGAERHAFLDESALPDLIRRSGRVWVYGPRDRASLEADTLGVRYQVVARTRNRELGLLEPMPPDSGTVR
jgi:4-amino-4-deoxy-L-arabinose transferase-like glycosyltransferase